MVKMIAKSKKDFYYVHPIIGLLIIALFWFMPPIAPITPIGMRCAGIFLSMIYLCSTSSMIWPSILAVFLIGISGYAGEGAAGFNTAVSTAFGANVVILILLNMILFGTLDEAGVTKYIAHWFVTRKIITGRPYVFMASFLLCVYILAGLIGSTTGLLISWPIALKLMDSLNVNKSDDVWKYFFIGVFIAAVSGMSLLPFKSAPLVIVSSFENCTQFAYPILDRMFFYITYSFIMSLIIMALYLLVVKFIFRPDVSKLKKIDAKVIAKEQALPPLNLVQRCYLIMIPCYLFMVLYPSFGLNLPGVDFCRNIGALGITMLWVVIFSVVKAAGKVFLDFVQVATKQFNWSVYFLIIAIVYAGNSVSDPSSGIPEFLLQVLEPILGGRSELEFVAIIFVAALILTNLASNVPMACILMPVIVAFSGEMGINPTPIAMGVCMMVFIAMLTPAACPDAGMMYGRTDIYDAKDIRKIGLPISFAILLLWIFIGYPLGKIIFRA